MKNEKTTLCELVTREQFMDWFNGLELYERLQIAREFATEYGSGEEIPYEFDDEFFSTYFTDPMEAARATYFGKIQSWADPYIRFNAYGNLESMSENEVIDWCEYTAGELYDCEEALEILDWCGIDVDDIAAEIAEEATAEA